MLHELLTLASEVAHRSHLRAREEIEVVKEKLKAKEEEQEVKKWADQIGKRDKSIAMLKIDEEAWSARENRMLDEAMKRDEKLKELQAEVDAMVKKLAKNNRRLQDADHYRKPPQGECRYAR